MMDVSGSMGDEQKKNSQTHVVLARYTWLTNQYKGLERRYIIHDATAMIVDQDTFYKTKESGGTLISSAYRLAEKIIDEEFNRVTGIYIYFISQMR